MACGNCRRQCVPKNIEEKLVSNLALAVWYLDDGALRTDCKAFRLHTNSYSLELVLLLKRTLLLNFGITCHVERQDASKSTDDREFLLAIGASDGQAERFSAKIRPLVASMVPSMLYKFF